MLIYTKQKQLKLLPPCINLAKPLFTEINTFLFFPERNKNIHSLEREREIIFCYSVIKHRIHFHHRMNTRTHQHKPRLPISHNSYIGKSLSLALFHYDPVVERLYLPETRSRVLGQEQTASSHLRQHSANQTSPLLSSDWVEETGRQPPHSNPSMHSKVAFFYYSTLRDQFSSVCTLQCGWGAVSSCHGDHSKHI